MKKPLPKHIQEEMDKKKKLLDDKKLVKK